MNQESKNLIYQAIKELIEKLELALRDGEKYNGWPTYETWNMYLILSNNQEIDNEINAFLHQELNEYNTEDKPFSSLTNNAKQDILVEIAESLKSYIEENYQLEEHESIIKVDCEYWTYRDFQEINWYSIVKTFLEDYLRESGFKEE